ncbi:PAS domain S-box protein [Pseudorhodoferax sp.]|uniref:PAS domain-containing sensor histidine kinase n=1 Tax=Pseudorhodoferax sp. TaxID=1993553 RepID=UPI0039E58B2C
MSTLAHTPAQPLSPFSEEARYRLLVEAVTDYAIYMLDPQGLVVSWNSGAQRLKGYAPAEILGRSFASFYTPGDRDAGVPQRALAQSAEHGRFEAEGWRVRKDGSEFWAHVVIDPIRGEDGRILGYAKVTRDLTDRRRIQQELERAREALFQAQKLDAIGQLTGGVAHDFNNLLMVILSSLTLARKRLPDDDKLRQLVDNGLNAARRGATLTQRMLAFARRQELKPTVVHLPALVRGMADLLARSLGSAVQVHTEFPIALPPVRVDANQLELALLNLAVNARDAMPDGGRLLIRAQEEAVPAGRSGLLAPGRYVRLSVVDSGMGMDAATLARATEPFFTTKGSGKGTGLGVPMVHGLAAQSGGRFVLDSRPGAGTTATLWLPVADAAPPQQAGDGAAPAPQAAPGANLPRLRVLVVDDDPLVLSSTSALLEELGHKALQAGSAEEALRTLRGGAAVDLLLTDHVMPRRTGAQLIAAVAAQFPLLPAVLATGYAELPTSLPASAVRLAKPFDQPALAQALAEALQCKGLLRG